MDCTCGSILADLENSDSRSQPMKSAYERALITTLDFNRASQLWHLIVRQYSSRKLTHEKDRFPALSGISRLFQTRGLGDFVAGLWTNDFPLMLLWKVDRADIPRNANFVAPPWSWASIPSGVMIEYDIIDKWRYIPPHRWETKQVMIYVNDVHCELAGLDPTGEIKSAYLSVSGPTIDAHLEKGFMSKDGQLMEMPTIDAYLEKVFISKEGQLMEISIDYTKEEMLVWEGSLVQCLMVCLVERIEPYVLILVAKNNSDLHQRIGMTYANIAKTYFNITDKPDPKMAEWFINAEQRSFTII